MAQLTKMQQKIYDYIAQAIQDQGYPPSVREIGEAVGLKSPSTVHFHLKHLEELGVIGKQAGKGRALTLTEASRESQAPESQPPENQVPIVGNVAAGSPILAQELPSSFFENGLVSRSQSRSFSTMRRNSSSEVPSKKFHFRLYSRIWSLQNQKNSSSCSRDFGARNSPPLVQSG